LFTLADSWKGLTPEISELVLNDIEQKKESNPVKDI
jgi:hypothetical protein